MNKNPTENSLPNKRAVERIRNKKKALIVVADHPGKRSLSQGEDFARR
jgi:hypothetical protein